MIEDLIGALIGSDLRIRDFDANVDALLFGIALPPAQYGDCVIRAFFPRHASPFAWNCNESWASNIGAHVDTGMSGIFNLVMEFLADQSILETGSRTSHQGGRQAILHEDRHLQRCGQIYALESNCSENLAPLLERSRRAGPNRSHHALLDAAARSRRGLGGHLTG